MKGTNADAAIKNWDRVRENTSGDVIAGIDREMGDRVRSYAIQRKSDIGRRLHELDHEWGMERVLETNASVIALAGLALGAFLNPWWLILPAVVLVFLFQHAVQGWCPPVPAFRRLGFRTRQEIDREKYALRALRGDFEIVPVDGRDDALRAENALRAVRA